MKTVVFDWNGTLFDDVAAVVDATNALMAHFTKDPVTLETYREHFDIPLTRFYARTGFSEAELNGNWDSVQNVFHSTYETAAEDMALRSGAAELLRDLQGAGIRSIILSNHTVPAIAKQLRRFGIHAHIERVMAHDDVASQFRTLSKQDKLRALMADERAQPEDVVIMGDTMEEIGIAHALGITGIGISGGFVSEERLRDAKPHHLVAELHEVAPILKRAGFWA